MQITLFQKMLLENHRELKVLTTAFCLQDGSSESESDMESSQMRPLIKAANGTARDLKKNSQGNVLELRQRKLTLCGFSESACLSK